jgi:hypothetical protein
LIVAGVLISRRVRRRRLQKVLRNARNNRVTELQTISPRGPAMNPVTTYGSDTLESPQGNFTRAHGYQSHEYGSQASLPDHFLSIGSTEKNPHQEVNERVFDSEMNRNFLQI